jgi:hypothetical protein
LPSHFSPLSTTPFPHTGLQSVSVFAFAPVGQHMSPPIALVIITFMHIAVHLAADPTSMSFVHGSLSSQDVGHGI